MNRRFSRFLESRKAASVDSLAELRAKASDIKAALREVSATPGEPASLENIPPALKVCCEHLEASLAQTQDALAKLAGRRMAAGDAFRLMQASHSAYRLPKTPDWLNTVSLAAVAWSLEGAAAGAALVSEGRMDVPAGLAYGLIFALVNIILGLLIGYLPLRYLSYRSPLDLSASDGDARPDRRASLIRKLSAFGLTAGLVTEAVLIFGAARLRALGSHEGVFDFSDVGFWATFDDSLAIIIAVIGVCSVTLAVLKGFSGIDDPIPGFQDAYRQATADVDEAAEEIADQAEDEIRDRSDAALEAAEGALVTAREALEDGTGRYAEVARRIDRFNDDVRNARDAAQAQARQDRGVASYVTGRTQALPTRFDPEPYDDLIQPGIEDEAAKFCSALADRIAPVEAALAELEATRQRCFAEIRAALAAFRTSGPNLTALFDEGEDDA